ncbi:Pre-mRNA-splicing factor sap61 [Coemansia sp. RSA 1813]|nr:Pre-mRNA-splicing factor sap61 [Coemansia sp. RSA 1646]KAJ1773959.1 Pre-mRNA-splicing factor sap61 [Coemansia sp. RSA 1843]KAJ2089321.1 Pre-mRNA-splicing factor sap61 [Coemansia sp. RSA 986]KAJ2214424.1 Pre-mRNA-splicing factor sap61 [Coemansia sp. RSA 487]KAJ2569354.1 Pre-mRNA-splicing factor sap61 [Coemansia sp. RSA 1813]
MDGILELQRQAHEDIERLEQAIVDLMLQNLTKHRYRLVREQKINGLLDQIQSRSKFLIDIENDLTGLRQREVTGMIENGFDDFYKRLGAIHSYHRQHPESAVNPPELEYIKYKNNPEELEEKRRKLLSKAKENDEQNVELIAEPESLQTETFLAAEDEEKLDTMFSGEERFGRYVDLNEQYELYLNLKDVKHTSYLDYLVEFTKFEAYPRKNKSQQKYVEYLFSLRQYFEGFFLRAMPLFNVPSTQKEAEEEFAQQWQKRKAADWEDNSSDGSLGQELFCAACKKQFEKSTTFSAHMNSRKHKKTVARLQGEQKDTANATAVLERALDEKIAQDKETAWLEHLVHTYALVLADKISDTKANVERRQALTEAERNQEIDEEEPEFIEEDDDKDDQIYNPLNLPLGWDGKPIPYWLYKLHGLGVKFSCEICGNAVHRGRKAYEKHFQESRHATNMRRLGIPNTRQFHGVSSIEEALALWERIQKEKKQAVANTDTFEEFEDSEGNVFNKKTYYDLKRQGLI